MRRSFKIKLFIKLLEWCLGRGLGGRGGGKGERKKKVSKGMEWNG